ncbi:MAG: hypothetical protein KGY99_09000 [Phycisphaerae bacterium]|nr:hypothetical protein [Phycisphaerae bacterium]
MCPFVNASDPRCAAKLALSNLTRAFADCAGTYAQCVIYRRLMRDRQDLAYDHHRGVRLAS